MNADERRWIERPTVRVVLLDLRDRVLLFRFEDDSIRDPNGQNHRSFWVTPGGALNAAEDFETAAARELFEETGLADVALGAHVWKRRKILEWNNQLVMFDERYYLARTDATSVCVARLHGHERAVYREHRWWTIHEILRTDDVIFPAGLGALLLPIVTGAVPTRPIAIE